MPNQNDFRVLEVGPYKIHQRILEKYHHGRVVFVGDAALNNFIWRHGNEWRYTRRWNLAEKLKEILFDGRPLTRLDVYSEQRQKIAENEILKNAHKNRSRMQERDESIRTAELKELKKIASDPERSREFC